MNYLLSDYISVWCWEQNLALASLSPAAQDLVLSGSKELFRSLKADNLRNHITVDFPGCSWELARELLDLFVLVERKGDTPSGGIEVSIFDLFVHIYDGMCVLWHL